MRRLQRRVFRRLVRSLGGSVYACPGCGALYGDRGACEDCGVALMPAPVRHEPERAGPRDHRRRER